jgi:bla regulator protein blaR1
MSVFLDIQEMMRGLHGKRSSFVVLCALFLAAESLAGQGISVRAQGSDQASEKAAVSHIVSGVFGGLRATAAQELAGPAESKQWKFAVVSIRKNNSGGPQHIGVTTADGYQMKNMFLGYLILMAYVPQTGGALYSADQFIGMPAWLTGDDDHYDVDAKVDEADLADWQNPATQPAMLRSMLQAMLEDRLKLVVHRSTREAPLYLLVVGKSGPKFKETNPAELHPGARPMPGGGTLSREQKDDQMTVHYFGISIPQLARWVLGGTGRPVQDKTGLRVCDLKVMVRGILFFCRVRPSVVLR